MSEGRDLTPADAGTELDAADERRVIQVTPDQVWQPEPDHGEPSAAIVSIARNSFLRPVWTVLAVSCALMGGFIAVVAALWWWER